MSQFGLSSTNSHWSYSSAGPYSPYLTSCTTPTASQFNNPALGFTCSSGEPNAGQDFSTSARDCVTMLPDSTAVDLDQHLSSLVGATQQARTHMVQTNIISTGSGVNASSGNGDTSGSGSNGNSLTPQIPTHISNGLIVPRYAQTADSNHADAYGLTNSQSEIRLVENSLSDSSQVESPVQDDLLSSNTPNLGSSGPSSTTGAGGSGADRNSASGGGSGAGSGHHPNFSNIVMNQSNGGSIVSTTPNYVSSNGTGSCNGSPLYPVLPASILYSQLYSAANQTVGGFSHSFNHHHHQIQSPNGAVTAATAVTIASGASSVQTNASTAVATAAAAAMHVGELQSVMDHITAGTSQVAAMAVAAVSQRHHHHQTGANLIAGHTGQSGGGAGNTHSDLSLMGNCSAMARGAHDESGNRALVGTGVVNGRLGGPPGNSSQVGQATDNGNSVWRPY
uniref:Uncharacterized protein n=1 Tax=Anopheles epiroticus TaxID=199890 RepID=A0A182PWN5_9DIPT